MLPFTVALLQGLAVPDTQVVRMLPPPDSWFAQVTGVATGILTLLTLVLVVVAIWAALRLQHTLERTRASLDGVGKDMRELADSARQIVHDVSEMTTSVRGGVASVAETIEYSNARARRAVASLADRVDAFNETLTVVQDDTQSVVVAALSALRGVRAGIDALRRPARRKPARPRDYDEDDDDPEADRPARPRLRRRARNNA